MSRKAYVVANLEVIHDRDKFRDYERGLVKSWVDMRANY